MTWRPVGRLPMLRRDDLGPGVGHEFHHINPGFWTDPFIEPHG